MGRDRRRRNRQSAEVVKGILAAAAVLLLCVAVGLAVSPAGRQWLAGVGSPAADGDMTPDPGAMTAPAEESTVPTLPSPETPQLTPQQQIPTATPEPTPLPTAAATPVPTQAPTPVPTPTPKPLAGFVVGIDPGHQSKANYDQESVSPGSDQTKAKVSAGTAGRFSGVAEYEVNLQVGLKLRDLLVEAGATVIMTRETNDVNISNAQRAQLFNDNMVDIGLRIHCNGVDDSAVKGAFMLVPADKAYPYYQECIDAAELILASYLEATGFENRKGITYRSDMTGFNWCERPTCLIEMGHMTNKEDDLSMADDAFQYKMAQGLFNGIKRYLLGA